MLGRLEKVELRDVWKHEALDFTNWLAKEENISLLSDTVGIDIEIIETEASVGSFNVDVLAKDSNTDSKIIIENQLERTDHDHLGKIITYASGYDAETIIWLVKDVRDEHRKAVEWLNNHLDDKINIFLIRIEVWRIGDSAPAAKFSIVESPNNWAKVMRNSSGNNSGELTDRKKLQLDFWTKLNEYSQDNYKGIKLSKPAAKNWHNISSESKLYSIPLTMSSRDEKVGVEVYIHSGTDHFEIFHKEKDRVEQELGYKMEWQELPNRKASRVAIYKDFLLEDETKWEENYRWLLDRVEEVKEAFKKIN